MAKRYEAEGFERFWNSTFGVPQQFLFRFLRAWQDDEVDLLSEEGILDMSLIPGVGIYDDDRHDTSAAEMVKRTVGSNEKPSWQKELAVSILTDPLTLLTGGATAAARGGISGVKAMRTASLGKVLKKAGVETTELMASKGTRVSQNEFLGHIDDALLNLTGPKAGKQYRLLKKARKTIASLDDGKGTMQDLLSKTKNTELRVGLPVLHNIGAGIAVTEKNKYWLGFLKSKVAETKGGRAIGTIMSDMGGLPYMTGALERLTAVGQGLKYGRSTTDVTKTSNLGDRGFELVSKRLTQEAGELFGINEKKKAQSLGSAFDLLMTSKEKMDPRKAFLKVMLNRKGIDPSKIGTPKSEAALAGKFDRYARAFFGLDANAAIPEITGGLITKTATGFHSKYRVANNYFNNSMSKLTKTKAGQAEKKWADKGKGVFSWWTKGKQVSQTWGKLFRHGGKVEELDAANQLAVRLEAQTTSELRTIGDDLAELLSMDAKELGVNPDFLDKFFLKTEQGRPLMSEVTEFLGAFNKKGADSTKAASAINNFITRMGRTIDSAGVQAREGQGSTKFNDLMEYVASRFSDEGSLSKVEFKAEYDSAAWIPAVSKLASVGGPSVNRLTITEGRHVGKIAGTLEDSEIVEAIDDLVIKRLEGGGELGLRTKGDRYRLDRWFWDVGEDEVLTMPSFSSSASHPRPPVKTTRNIKKIFRERLVEGKGFNKPKTRKYDSSPNKVGWALDYYIDTMDKEGALDMMGIPFHPEDVDFGEVGNQWIRWQNKLLKSNTGMGDYVDAYDEASALLDYMAEVEFPTAYDIRHLNSGQKSTYYKLDKLKQLREHPTNPEMVRVAKEQLKESLPPRMPSSLTARVKGSKKEVKLNDFGYAVGRLKAAASEMKRSGELGVGPDLIRTVEESLVTIQNTWDDAIRETMGESTRFLDLSRELRKRSFDAAAKQGTWHIGAPLAYVGRIFSRESRELLDKTLNDRGLMDAMDSALPTLGSSMARSADNMTIEELNAIHFALKNGTEAEKLASKSFRETIEKVAKNEGIELTEDYTESLFLSSMARHSQALHTQANVDYVGEALNSLSKSKVAMTGTIKSFITAGSEEVAGVGAKSSEKVRKGETILSDREVPIKMRASGMIIEHTDGTTSTVPISFLTNDAYAGILLGKGHSDLGKALGVRATRGALREADQISRRIDPRDYNELVGEGIFLGEKGAVNGVFNSMQTIWQGSSKEMVYVDAAQYMVKRFQTVYRPAFTVSNLASMFSQMTVIGLKPQDQLAGIADALRWLGGSEDVSKAYSKWGVHNAAQSKKKIGGLIPSSGRNFEMSFLNDIKRGGIDELLELTPEEVIKKYPHLKHEDLMMDVGGQQVSQLEILEAWRSTNLMGTFISEGLRGGSSVSRTTMQIKAKALKEATAMGKVGKVIASPFKKAEKMAEAGEVTVRIAAFFGGVRSGKSLLRAAEDAKLAAVDYSNLTRAERFGFKRWFTYYTFPRHFLPVAGKHFARNIDQMAGSAHLLNEGPWREERGRLKYDFELGGKQLSTDATRIMPHLESLKVGETLGEIFLGTGAMFSDQIERVQQKERLRQETPFTLTTGSIQQAGFAAVDGNEETNTLSILTDAFWVNRFVFDPDDPRREQSTLHKLRKVAFPVSDRILEQETAMLRRRYRKIKTQLTDAANATDDPNEKMQFMQEIQYLADKVALELKETQDLL